MLDLDDDLPDVDHRELGDKAEVIGDDIEASGVIPNYFILNIYSRRLAS